MWRRQSELPTWLQQQLRLRRLHGGNSQAVPARARRCSSARIQVLLPQHRGGLIYSSALQKEWCSEELLLLLLLRDARPGAARDKRRWLRADPHLPLPWCPGEKGLPRVGNASSEVPRGRGAEPSSGTDTQLGEAGAQRSGPSEIPMAKQIAKTNCNARSPSQKAPTPEHLQGLVGAVLSTQKPRANLEEEKGLSCLPRAQGQQPGGR